jgi:hypothetical protein
MFLVIRSPPSQKSSSITGAQIQQTVIHQASKTRKKQVDAGLLPDFGDDDEYKESQEQDDVETVPVAPKKPKYSDASEVGEKNADFVDPRPLRPFSCLPTIFSPTRTADVTQAHPLRMNNLQATSVPYVDRSPDGLFIYFYWPREFIASADGQSTLPCTYEFFALAGTQKILVRKQIPAWPEAVQPQPTNEKGENVARTDRHPGPLQAFQEAQFNRTRVSEWEIEADPDVEVNQGCLVTIAPDLHYVGVRMPVKTSAAAAIATKLAFRYP